MTTDDDRRVPITPLIMAIAMVAMTVALARVAGGLVHIVGLVILAALLAWLTGPFQQRIANRVGGATSMVVLVLLALGIGLGVGGLLAKDLSDGTTALSARISDSLSGGSGGGVADRIGRSLRLGDGVAEWLSSLPNTAVFGGDGTPAVGKRVVDIVVVVVLMLFFRGSSTSIVSGLIRLWPRPQREHSALHRRRILHRYRRLPRVPACREQPDLPGDHRCQRRHSRVGDDARRDGRGPPRAACWVPSC